MEVCLSQTYKLEMRINNSNSIDLDEVNLRTVLYEINVENI